MRRAPRIQSDRGSNRAENGEPSVAARGRPPPRVLTMCTRTSGERLNISQATTPRPRIAMTATIPLRSRRLATGGTLVSAETGSLMEHLPEILDRAKGPLAAGRLLQG